MRRVAVSQLVLVLTRKSTHLELTPAEIDTACGVGVVVSDADIAKAISKAIESNKAELTEDRYHFPIGEHRDVECMVDLFSI
jgi:hypothetical protein